jgi:hypothetical protein
MASRKKYQFSDFDETTTRSPTLPRASAPSERGEALRLLRLLKRERWDEVATYLYDKHEVDGADRLALAGYFTMLHYGRRGRPSEPSNYAQEAMQWARYFFHAARLPFLKEQKRKRLTSSERTFLAEQVIIKTNEEYAGALKEPLKASDLIGPANSAPADQPAPKRVGHIFGDDYQPHARRVTADLLATLRAHTAKN